jgi:hypothetical protein
MIYTLEHYIELFRDVMFLRLSLITIFVSFCLALLTFFKLYEGILIILIFQTLLTYYLKNKYIQYENYFKYEFYMELFLVLLTLNKIVNNVNK